MIRVIKFDLGGVLCFLSSAYINNGILFQKPNNFNNPMNSRMLLQDIRYCTGGGMWFVVKMAF